MEVSLLCTAICASRILNEAVAPMLHRVLAACVTGTIDRLKSRDWNEAATGTALLQAGQ